MQRRACPTGTVSRYSSRLGPSNQGMLSLGFTTLSPASALIGTKYGVRSVQSGARKSRNSASMCSNTGSS